VSTLPGQVDEGRAAATFCATLVDEWVRAGVRFGVVSPGSRSTPMALALAADERIELVVRLDERSASFLALGMGLSTGVPAVLLTTSGTAAAEVHAAVVEAHQAGVPLLVCTADRPPELHGVGAPQTIEQRGLYGRAVRLEHDPGVPSGAGRSWWRSLGARAFAAAVAHPIGPGPVHLNLPFAEPLDGLPGELPVGRVDGGPWHRVGTAVRRSADGESVVGGLLRNARRPLLVVGARPPSEIRSLATAGHFAVLADPRSGLRSCPGDVVATADALLRDPGFREAHEPDLVIRIGEAWASKVVNAWLDETAARGVPHILVDPYGDWRDPGRTAGHVVPDLGALLAERPRTAPSFVESWLASEHVAQEAIDSTLEQLGATGELCDPAIARMLTLVPGVGALVVSSSMPVRDLEWFSRPAGHYPVAYANRGANGIDGVVSTAVGVARGWRSAGRKGEVVAVVGDLAFLHDASALVRPAGSPDRVGIVVVDNRGGGIFSYLAQARSVAEERYEQLFGTPQAVDPADLARSAGCNVTVVEHPGDLEPALGGLVRSLEAGEQPVVVCRTDRARGPAVHDALNAAVARALGEVGGLVRP
jgi:2-succinyl-5-enolpyruvyl-6-hydroxy-3-cyclohexene-1-carboxylate synthase